MVKSSAFIIQKIQISSMEKDMNESQILEDYIEERQKQESETIKIKKSYLKQKILDVYTQEDKIDKFLEFFLLYLRKVKGIETQDHNLDYLSLQQLKHLVGQFHSSCPPSLQNDIVRAQNTIETNLTTVVQLKEEQFDAKKVYYPNGSWDYQLVGYQQCKKVKEYFLVEGDYSNNLVFFEKQQIKKTGGFFGIGGRYQLWIEIRSNLFKETVMRKIQDFILLKKVLSNLFPYVFIYPLQISQRQLQKVNQESIRVALVNQCRKFINYICKNELLLQNYNTHRFFKEQNYQNYVNHQKNHIKVAVNRIKMLQNIDGCVPIEISDKIELTKKDFVRKTTQIEWIWNRLEQSNTRISNKLKQVHVQVQKQRKDIERIIMQFTNVNPMLKSKVYDHTIQTMIGYSEIFKNYQENINNFQFLFQSVSLRVASQSKKTWNYFNKYTKDICEFNQEYHLRRKVFLEKQDKRKDQTNQKQKEAVESEQLDPINKSIINKLGISNNMKDGVKETVWIERFSKWQAYINKQFTNSFQRLLQTDMDTLKKILRQNLQNRCEMRGRQEQLIKSLQKMF